MSSEKNENSAILGQLGMKDVEWGEMIIIIGEQRNCLDTIFNPDLYSLSPSISVFNKHSRNLQLMDPDVVPMGAGGPIRVHD